MLEKIALEKAYRLINHGPTVMLSAKYAGVENVMSISWACALEFQPAKVTAVIDKVAYSRYLVEQSGYFALQVPFARQAKIVMAMGESYKQNPHKLADNHVGLFYLDNIDIPLVKGCSAYLLCKLIPDSNNQQQHDLFIGDVIAAYADNCVFRDGHWRFDEVSDDFKNLHYVAGGQFFITGKGLNINSGS